MRPPKQGGRVEIRNIPDKYPYNAICAGEGIIANQDDKYLVWREKDEGKSIF